MIIKNATNIINLIKCKLNRELKADHIKIKGFYKISFDFYSPPYPIVYTDNKFVKLSDYNTQGFLGHIIFINGEPFIINKEGHFTLEDFKIFQISSITLKETEDVSINYNIVYDECQLTTDKNNEKLEGENSTVLPQETDFGKGFQVFCNAAPNTILLNKTVSYIDIEGDCGCEIILTIDDIDSSFWIGQTERLSFEGNISKILFNSFKSKRTSEILKSRDFYINYQRKE